MRWALCAASPDALTCLAGAAGAAPRAMPDRRQSSGVLTELALYAVSALISFALLNNVLKKLDPNQQNSKQARPPPRVASAVRRVSEPRGLPLLRACSG
jgi:hypothetical protein